MSSKVDTCQLLHYRLSLPHTQSIKAAGQVCTQQGCEFAGTGSNKGILTKHQPSSAGQQRLKLSNWAAALVEQAATTVTLHLSRLAAKRTFAKAPKRHRSNAMQCL